MDRQEQQGLLHDRLHRAFSSTKETPGIRSIGAVNEEARLDTIDKRTKRFSLSEQKDALVSQLAQREAQIRDMEEREFTLLGAAFDAMQEQNAAMIEANLLRAQNIAYQEEIARLKEALESADRTYLHGVEYGLSQSRGEQQVETTHPTFFSNIFTELRNGIKIW